MSLSKNTVWNIAGNALPLAIGAITIPILIQQLGLERFGILTLLWAIVGYFSLFDFGIGRAITQQIASLSTTRQNYEVPATIKAGLEFTILTGLLGAAILGFAAYPLSYNGMGVSDHIKQEVFISLIIAAIGIPLATLSSGLRGALEGYEHFQASNIARIFLGASLFLFPLISVLTTGESLVAITLWLVGARLASCILFMWLVIKLPSGKFWKAKIGAGIRKRLLSFGAWMAITNLLSPLLVNIDRFIISYLLGASVIAYYTLPFEFLVRLLILPGALGASLLPNLARDNAIDPERSRATFLKCVKITIASMFVLCTFAALISFPLMKFFISEEFASKSWIICVILSFGVFLNGVAYIPYTALHAQGTAKPTALLHILELILYIPILLIFVHFMGLNGAALAWTLRAAVDAMALFAIYLRRMEYRVFS